MNDSPEPIDLSPSRAELIARVRTRGRQIRARRRLGIVSLTALVVIGIAAPAIAIGAGSGSRSVPPATVAAAKGDFRVALVTDATEPPCAPGTLAHQGFCFELGESIMDASDVVDTLVSYDGGAEWIVNVTVKPEAIQRLATFADQQVAIIVGGKMISAPSISSGLTGTHIQVFTGSLTRAEATELAKTITGSAPADSEADLTTRIELESDTVVAGSQLKGTLVVENHTDTPIDVADGANCRVQDPVALGNGTFTNNPVFNTACMSGPWLIDPGITRWPLTITTNYYKCTRADRPLRGVPTCPPGTAPLNSTPPLPVGEYEARLVIDGSGLLPDAPAVPVHVVAAASDLEARIELPGDEFVAGTKVEGTLVIENNTGTSVTLEGSDACQGKWEVAFTNAAVPPDVPFTQECGSGKTVIAPGTNRLPFTALTTYHVCTGSDPVPAGLVKCLADSGMPPLPLGEYETTIVDRFGGRFPTVPPVSVRIIAP